MLLITGIHGCKGTKLCPWHQVRVQPVSIPLGGVESGAKQWRKHLTPLMHVTSQKCVSARYIFARCVAAVVFRAL